MADNTTLNAGAGGDVIATDDVAGVKYPIGKLAFGALDTAVLAVAGSGVVTTGTLRVTLATDVALPAGTNAIGKLAANTGVDIGDVDVTSVPAPLSTTGGGTEATALRVTIASDSTGVVSIDDNGASLTVDLINQDDYDSGVGTDLMDMVGIAAAASGGHAAITGDVTNGLDVDVTRVGGTVAVTQSGTWDEVGINDSGNSITVDNAALSVVGGGVEATALRVTVASDSTGVLSVDDNGGTLTIDNAQLSVVGTGTEAAAMRVTIATDSTGVLSVDDNGGTLTVDVGTALPAGTNNIGDVDVLTIAAGDNNIGNVDIVTIAAGSTLIGDVGLQPRTTGGLSFFKTIDLDETEEEVKATAGQIYALHVMNLTAALLYFKIYNATAATVVVGTTVPDITIPVPANNDTDGAGFVWSVPQGIAFSTAITVAATTGIADADTGAPAANACAATVLYK